MEPHMVERKVDDDDIGGYVAGCFPTELIARATMAHPAGFTMVALIKRAFDRRRTRSKGRERPVVAVTEGLCAEWEVSRFQRHRIIAALEEAGLIVVEERRQGAAPLVRFADDVRFPKFDRPKPLPRRALVRSTDQVDVFDPSEE
jgi:hypothetical protein